MTTIASTVCHHCCNPDHLGTCFFAGWGSGMFGGFIGTFTACAVQPTLTLTGVLSGALGGGAIGACAGASLVTTYCAICPDRSDDSNFEVYYSSQPSITTRVVSKQPSRGGRGYGFNPDSSYYYDHGYSDGGHGGCYDGGHGGCSDSGGGAGCGGE